MSALQTQGIVDRPVAVRRPRMRRMVALLGAVALATTVTAWVVTRDGAPPTAASHRTSQEPSVLFGSGYPADYNPISQSVAATAADPVRFGSGYAANYDPVTGTTAAEPVHFGSGYPAGYNPISQSVDD